MSVKSKRIVGRADETSKAAPARTDGMEVQPVAFILPHWLHKIKLSRRSNGAVPSSPLGRRRMSSNCLGGLPNNYSRWVAQRSNPKGANPWKLCTVPKASVCRWPW